MSDPTKDALQQEKEMREHEAEARARDGDERDHDDSSMGISGDGVGNKREDGDDMTPPGNAGRGSNSLG